MSGSLPLLVRWLTSIGIIPKAAVTQLDSRRAPSAQSVLDAGRLAEKTYAALDSLNEDVVLIARMGQNLSQFGLKYSHMGFAVRGLRRGEWGVVHLLNLDGGAQSGIYSEGMVNFYSDAPFRFESALLTLPKRVHAPLRDQLLPLAKRLHCPNYSLTSYPWSLTSQNSNQWVLELLAAVVMGKEPTRENAQAWLREHHYTPTTLPIALPTQWAGPLLKDSIRFDDQPLAQRREARVQTVTVNSVVDFVRSAQGPFKDELAELKFLELSL